MSMVHEAVQDGVGDAPAAEVFVPVADGQLRRDDDCPGAVALLEGLKEILLFPVREAAEAEVV